VKFTWQFGISVVSQETANVVQGQGLDHVNLLQAAEFAAAATLIPGMAGKVTIGGKQVLQGASGAFVSGALTDTAIQGMEGITEGKPFSPGEVAASGVLAMGGQALAGAIGSRLGTEGVEPPAEDRFVVEMSRPGAVAAGANLTAPGDLLGKFAERASPEPGYYDVAVHGSPTDFGPSPTAWESGANYSHRVLARLIGQQPDYEGDPVRLMACRAGAPDASAAQNLANKLGVEVMAPSDTLWAWSDGGLTIGPKPGVNTGEWLRFLPGARE
jgi:hypothetical protein